MERYKNWSKYNKLTPTLKYTRIKSGFKNFGSFDAKTPQVKTKLFWFKFFVVRADPVVSFRRTERARQNFGRKKNQFKW